MHICVCVREPYAICTTDICWYPIRDAECVKWCHSKWLAEGGGVVIWWKPKIDGGGAQVHDKGDGIKLDVGYTIYTRAAPPLAPQFAGTRLRFAAIKVWWYFNYKQIEIYCQCAHSTRLIIWLLLVRHHPDKIRLAFQTSILAVSFWLCIVYEFCLTLPVKIYIHKERVA